MALKLDLHIHTNYSKCSWLALKSLVKLVQKKGLDGLAITDHNTMEGVLKFKKTAPFKVILGEEIDTQQGQIIGYFLEKEIPAGLTAQETIERIKRQGGLVAIPHPFDKVRQCRIKKQELEKIINQVDLIEVFNSRTLWPGAAKQAQALAQKHNIPQIAGSDAHSSAELGRAFIEIESFDGPEDFLVKVKSAKIINGHNPPWFYALSGMAKVYHRVKSL